MRLSKVESGTTTTYLNRGVNVLYEKSGTIINKYVLAGNLIIAKLTGSSVLYFHEDGLGSTRLVTTGSTTSFSTNYEPFGPQYGTSGTDPGYKYTGKLQDTATGLYYYAARFYDSATGGFISRDSAKPSLRDPQASNPYSYTRGNPERYTDPCGECLDAWGLGEDVVGLALGILGLRYLQVAEPSYWGSLVEGTVVDWAPQSYKYLSESPADITGLFFDAVIPAVLAIFTKTIQHLLTEGWEAAIQAGILGAEIASGEKEAEALADLTVFGIQLGLQLGNPSSPGLCPNFLQSPPITTPGPTPITVSGPGGPGPGNGSVEYVYPNRLQTSFDNEGENGLPGGVSKTGVTSVFSNL